MAALPGQKIDLLELITGPADELARRLVANPEIRRRLARERFGALIHYRLKAAGLTESLPGKYRVELRQSWRQVLRRQLIQEVSAVSLTRIAEEYQPVILKGLHFSRLLYPPGTRSSVDLDVFCPRRLYGGLAERLLDEGWRPREFGAYARRLYRTWVHLSWVKDDCCLEVHFDLVPPGRYRGYDTIWENRLPLELECGRVYVPEPEDAVLFALAHLSKEHLFESHLLWVLDLFRLAPLVDWNEVERRAEGCGLGRLYRFALAYLRRYDPLRRRLPPGTALPLEGWEWLLGDGGLVRFRARLLGLLLCQAPSRTLSYSLRRILWPLL